MTTKGYAPEQILRSINRKLNTLFPTGMPDLLVFGSDPDQAVTNSVTHSHGRPEVSQAATSACNGWQVNLSLHGPRLAEIDPVPLLMNQVHELAGVEVQRSALFTILTELFVNALDHGVLKLASELKAERNGFEAYMDERARRLAGLKDGWVSIVITAQPAYDAIEIVVTDSGSGFDIDAYYQACELAASTRASSPYGRGLALVRALCDTLEHQRAGAVTKVSYRWP